MKRKPTSSHRSRPGTVAAAVLHARKGGGRSSDYGSGSDARLDRQRRLSHRNAGAPRPFRSAARCPEPSSSCSSTSTRSSRGAGARAAGQSSFRVRSIRRRRTRQGRIGRRPAREALADAAKLTRAREAVVRRPIAARRSDAAAGAYPGARSAEAQVTQARARSTGAGEPR